MFIIKNEKNNKYLALGSQFAYTTTKDHAKYFNTQIDAMKFVEFNRLYGTSWKFEEYDPGSSKKTNFKTK